MGRHMGRHKQYSLLLYNLKLSVGFERMPICIPFHGLVVGTSSILHRAQPKGGVGKHKKEEAKRDPYENSFGVCLFNKRSICLSCN